jgi:hypothetical protein
MYVEAAFDSQDQLSAAEAVARTLATAAIRQPPYARSSCGGEVSPGGGSAEMISRGCATPIARFLLSASARTLRWESGQALLIILAERPPVLSSMLQDEPRTVWPLWVVPKCCTCRAPMEQRCRRSQLSRAGEAECDHERHPTPRAGSCSKWRRRSEEPPQPRPDGSEPQAVPRERGRRCPANPGGGAGQHIGYRVGDLACRCPGRASSAPASPRSTYPTHSEAPGRVRDSLGHRREMIG